MVEHHTSYPNGIRVPTRVATIRMPTTLYEQLSEEAHLQRKSLNLLCIERLQLSEPVLQKAKADVVEWNRTRFIGHPVDVRLNDQSSVITKTVSQAFLLKDQPSVCVDGVSHPVALKDALPLT